MHLYIHVPFCARRCSYCDFSIAVRRVVPDALYVDMIVTELRARHAEVAASPVATLYFGGGTPSRLGAGAIRSIIGHVRDSFAVEPTAEITIEVNPDDVTPTIVADWVAAGVNRVSLGVQSHDPAVLEWMHRVHCAEQVAPAVAMLRDAGIANLSLDLIFALPAHLERDWSRDIDLTLALAPQHVSLYGLTVEPMTPLARWTERGAVVPAADDTYARDYLLVHDALVSHAFEHYEVSNAALPGHRSRHNHAYWTGADYVGVGPSAHSFVGGKRSWNIREWEAYRAAVAEGRSVVAGSEEVAGDVAALESLYLGLRTSDGLPAARIPRDARQRWIGAGWAVEKDDRMTLTAEGWLRLDALVAGLGNS